MRRVWFPGQAEQAVMGLLLRPARTEREGKRDKVGPGLHGSHWSLDRMFLSLSRKGLEINAKSEPLQSSQITKN